MKILLLIFIILFFNSFTFSQKEEVVTLIQQRVIGLNSGTRAALGGKSRETIKIDLPENTIRWYYSFSTSSDGEGTKMLNLGVQIASILTTGLTSQIASLIQIPSGTGTADVYLLDNYNEGQFRTKQDQALFGTSYQYQAEGTVQNTKQALVQIDDVLSGTWYIGIKNPASVDAIFVYIEVVAIVDNSNETTWSEEMRDFLYTESFRALEAEGLIEPALSDLTTCMVETIIFEYSLTDVVEMTEVERSELEQKIYESCLGLFEVESDCIEAEEAELYGALGWASFESGKIDAAITYCETALEKCTENMGWVQANLGFFALIKEDKEKAVECYIQALKSFRSSKYASMLIQAAIDDIEKYENEYPGLKDCEEIRTLLESEK